MAQICLQTSKFKGAYRSLNGIERIEISRLEMVWASITLGFQRPDEAMGWRNLAHRIGLGMSAISQLDAVENHWKLHDSYSDLDPSEKTTMSYWQGMILAKLIAWKKLRIKHLIHADRVMGDASLPGTIISLSDGKRKGDFVGQDESRNWHVIEAKGRSSSIETDLRVTAKAQAKNLRFHAAGQPKTTSVCVTSLSEDPITVYLQDPPARRTGRGGRDGDSPLFWREYYQSLAGYIEDVGMPYAQLQNLEDPAAKILRRLGKVNRVRFAPLHPDPTSFIPDFFRGGVPGGGFYVGLPEKFVDDPVVAAQAFFSRSADGFVWSSSDEKQFVGPDLVHLVSI